MLKIGPLQRSPLHSSKPGLRGGVGWGAWEDAEDVAAVATPRSAAGAWSLSCISGWGCLVLWVSTVTAAQREAQSFVA